MSNRPLRILCLCHEASHTGAPNSLLRLVRYWKKRSDIQLTIVFGKGGPLLSKFSELAPVYVLSGLLLHRPFWHVRSQLYRCLSWLLLQLVRSREFDIVYNNTIANGEILSLIRPSCPVVTHVRELTSVIENLYPSFLETNKHTDRYLAVSSAVATVLHKKHNIAKTKIEVMYGCVCTTEIHCPNDKNTIIQELNIPNDAFLIVSCGNLEPRKAPHIFCKIATLVQEQFTSPVHFVWVGGSKQDCRCYFGDSLLQPYIHWIPTTPNRLQYIAAADIFMHPATEDPFPVVCLEAATLKKPVVCFRDGGGIHEFVEPDAGCSVLKRDATSMANAICRLLSDARARLRMGKMGQERILQHHTVENVGSILTKKLQQIAHNPST